MTLFYTALAIAAAGATIGGWLDDRQEAQDTQRRREHHSR